MGLFDIFTKNKVSSEVTNKPGLDDEIEFILSVLSNLGVLDFDKIDKNLSSDSNYNKELLSKITIKVDSDSFKNLKNYYESSKLGYGIEKLNIYRRRLHEVYKEGLQEGLSEEEILDKLAGIVKVEIENYEKIITALNDELNQIELTSPTENETRIISEFTINNYKEQELGFPVNLNNCVKSMANELVNLEYGGYGEEEVEQFVGAANKMIEEGKLNGESTNQTLSRINVELFTPKKNRYMSDLNTLKKKIDMIQSSPYISDFEKDQNRLKIINEFHKMNGHSLSINSTINRLKKDLTNLDQGGYGEVVLNKFEDDCNELVSKGKEEGLDDNELLRKIQSKYDKLIKEYEVHLSKLKEELDKCEDSSLREDLLQDFHDLVGHRVNYKKRLEEYKTNLENLEYGGYSYKIIDDFVNGALEKIDIISSNDELSNYMKQVRSKYRELYNNYKEELDKLNEEIDKIKNSKKKADDVKEKEINNLVLCFKSKFGHDINYNDVVEANINDLKNLELGGYGKKVLDDYRIFCDDILAGNEDSISTMKKIQTRYNELRKNYLKNVKIFKEWKRQQLKNKNPEEREELEKDLDTKITYMLSLSADDLYDYYVEDDRKKKAEAYRHNYMAAYRYLAREEAEKKKNNSLYDRRMEELKEGKTIYSSKDIEEATMKLETSSINNDNLAEEDRIISLIEYIDSTLFRQMLYVEASLSKKNNPFE